jgi:YD repeat-containing protein
MIRNVWKLGTLVEVTKGAETDSYEWVPFQHSAIYYQATSGFAGMRDEETYRPVLSKVTKTVNGAAHVTSYSNYDAYGNPTTVTETGPNGGSRTTTRTYLNDTNKWIIGLLKDETFSGGSTTRTFDANANLLSQTVDGVTVSQTYDAQGNLASRTYPRGLVHTYSNYKRGIAQTENQPEGITISRVVSDAGNVTSETNAEGKTTQYAYDLLNRPTLVTYPIGNARQIAYTATSSTSTRGNLIETTQFDSFERPTSVTRAGITTNYGYDPLGRKTFESNPGSSSGTSIAYDILNRPTRITNADGTYKQYGYGASTKTVTDERGNATTYSYRAYGNPVRQYLMSIAAPVAAANVSMQRNARDLVTSVTQAGKTRSYGYNSNYFLTSVINPETGTTTYGRDAAGNMTSRTVGSSGTTTYGYDNQDRQTSATFPSGPNITRTFNKIHQPLLSNSSTGTRSNAYDANGNLTAESLTIDGYTFTATHAYNGNDDLASTTYPRSGAVVSYSPDALGRPTAVSGYVSSVAYWPSDMVQQISYANGTISSYGQNNRMLPSSFATSKAGTGYINSSYGYDSVGNLTSISDTIDGTANRTLDYDGIDRLTSASGPWGAGSIAYDGGGNITNQSLGAFNLNYTYDASNRLSSVNGQRSATYTYDVYGNIAGGAGTTYTYDDMPRLRCVNCADPANKTEYTYDGEFRRSSVTKAGVKTYEMRSSNGNLLMEFTPQSNKLVEYLYLDDKRVAQRATP